MEAASRLKQLLAVYREAEDLIHIGAYQRGSNPDIDAAIEYIDRINAYTRQEIDEKVSFEEARRRLITEFRKG